MSAWMDGYLIPLLLGVPVLGMCFIAVMPGTDRIALRHAGLGAAVVTGFVALRAAFLALDAGASSLDGPLALSTSWGGLVPGGIRLGLDAARAPLLLGLVIFAPMTLRAGAPRIVERTKGYVLLNLLFLTLSIGALLSQHVLVTLALLDASMLPLLLLLGLFGGPLKGSTALRVGLSWLVVDAVAFAALTWLVARAPGGDASTLGHAAAGISFDERLFVFVAVALAAALRMALLPACAWFVAFFRDAPLSAAALAVIGVMPLGGYLLYDVGVALVPEAAVAALPVSLVVAAATCVLGGCLAAVERDLRLVAAGAGIVYGGVAFAGLSSLEPSAVAASLLFLGFGGASIALLLFCADALERRYVTRDTTELFGVLDELPGLWRLTVLALAIVAGFPVLGGGTLLLPLLAGLFQSAALESAGLPRNIVVGVGLAIGLGFVLLAVAVVVVVRRISSPHFRPEARARVSFSAWQSLRLWLPALTLVAAGLFVKDLFAVVEPVIAARLRAPTSKAVSAAAAIEENEENDDSEAREAAAPGGRP